MQLYSSVDLIGNVNMFEKLVLGGTEACMGPPDPQPDALTSAPSRHASNFHSNQGVVIYLFNF